MNILKALLFLALVSSMTLAESPLISDETLTISDVFNVVQQLKGSVDASAKEQWDALQSLRFYLLSARTGLKQALDQIEELRLQVKGCKAFVNSTATEEKPSIDSTEPTTTTTTKAPECQWPGELVSDRCLMFITDELKNWHEAQHHCGTLGGKLAGMEGFEGMRNHLTEQFGVDSESRTRWSMWTGGRQELDGWIWTDAICTPTPVGIESWAEYQPHETTALNVTQYCMALDGFNGYRGTAVTCTALRRFVCDLS